MLPKKRILVPAFVLGMLAYGGSALSSGDQPPPQPAWEKPDGTLDMNKVPDRVPIADFEGNIAGYASKEDIYGDNTPSRPPGMSFEAYVDGVAEGTIEEPLVPVTDKDGNLVGHVVPGGSFVPLER